MKESRGDDAKDAEGLSLSGGLNVTAGTIGDDGESSLSFYADI